MPVITARVSDELVDTLNQLVKNGVYPNRNVAVNELLKSVLAHNTPELDRIKVAVVEATAQLRKEEVVAALSKLLTSGKYGDAKRLLRAVEANDDGTIVNAKAVKMARTFLAAK